MCSYNLDNFTNAMSVSDIWGVIWKHLVALHSLENEDEQLRYLIILAMKNFVFLAFCNLTTILDAIDKKYICSIWFWYFQWFIFSFVYEEIWICNYAQLHDRCNMVPIWSQPKEVNQALMIGSCLVLFEVTVSIKTFTDTSPGSLVINMPIVVWYNDLVSTSLSYDFKDDISDLLIYCIKFRQWFSSKVHLLVNQQFIYEAIESLEWYRFNF